jgi:hypothetical protein
MTRGVKCHDLKTWPEYFELVVSGEKLFEARYAGDRDFEIGDILLLREFNPLPLELGGEYTGRIASRKVTYILRGGQMGVERDFVLMGFRDVEAGATGATGAAGI